jgi:hypothetical protein
VISIAGNHGGIFATNPARSQARRITSILNGAYCDKPNCIVEEGTPDFSGRTINYASPLPHVCGVPSQCQARSVTVYEPPAKWRVVAIPQRESGHRDSVPHFALE